MTLKEFSDEFDTLANAWCLPSQAGSSNMPFNIDEYEKSVFLTKAQEELVRGLYEGRATGLSFEMTEILRSSLEALIKTAFPEKTEGTGIDSRSVFYKLDKDVWVITYEDVELEEGPYCKDKTFIRVIPVRQDEWHRLRENPFKRPDKRKAVRLDSGGSVCEIVSDYPVKRYRIRYLERPEPIVLVKLDDGLSVNGTSERNECKLDEMLHRPILEMAVRMALSRPGLQNKN